jgi:hypothetical protein
MSNRIILSGMLLLTAACVTQVLNAQGTLVCQGTRLNGTPFTFPFVANTSPAPTLGVTCVPNGKKMPKGKAVMGTAPKASQVFAVVFVPPSTAGGASTSGAGPAGATLVCQGTRLNGTPFTLPFVANTSPAPTPGVACVPNGKKMPKGTAVMGTAPKASQVFAVVFVPPSTAGGASNANQQSNSSPPAAAPAATTPPVPPAIKAAIPNLENAKSNFEMAGSNWGPHLQNAINDIGEALTLCGQPQPPGNGEVVSGVANSPAKMAFATEQLTQAQTEFKNAKNPWGGRRDSALAFIAEALEEIKLATAAANAPK